MVTEKTLVDFINCYFRVFLTARPKIISQPLSMELMQGRTIILDCNMTSKPLPTIIWLKNGNLLKQNNNITISIINAYKNSRLIIYNASISDQGLYRCNGTNLAGSTLTNAANITIYSKWPRNC